MTSNRPLRKLTFTGSTEIGKLLMEQCAATVKKTSMELGGNAPFNRVRRRRYRDGGQGRDRLEIPQRRPNLCLRQPHPVQDGVYDTFSKRLAEVAGAMKVADGFEPGAVIGPLIDMKAVEKVETPYRRCPEERRQGGDRWQTFGARRQLFRADGWPTSPPT